MFRVGYTAHGYFGIACAIIAGSKTRTLYDLSQRRAAGYVAGVAFMKAILRATYRLPVFLAVLWLMGPLARITVLERLVLYCMRTLAGLVAWAHNAAPADSAALLIQEWQRMMPAPRNRFPIQTFLDEQSGLEKQSGSERPDASSEQVGVGEIHLHCPLRDSGAARACWRLMEFDRALVARMHGQLVVTDSQATSGKSCCKIEVRMTEQSTASLDAQES